MITDSQLNTIAISFGLLSAGLILAYTLLENNTKPKDEIKKSE